MIFNVGGQVKLAVKRFSSNLSFFQPICSKQYDKLYVTYHDFPGDTKGLYETAVYQSIAIVKSYLYHLLSFD